MVSQAIQSPSWISISDASGVYGCSQERILAIVGQFHVRTHLGKVYVPDLDRIRDEAPFVFIPRRLPRRRELHSFAKSGVFSRDCPGILRSLRMAELKRSWRRRRSEESRARKRAAPTGDMKFHPDMLELIRSGKKDVTRRMENRWRLHQIVKLMSSSGEPSGMVAEIVGIRRGRLGLVGQYRDWEREGFDSKAAAIDRFREIYPGASAATIVWRIVLRLL